MDETLDGWLAEQIEGADAASRESHSIAMNSYGAGHDAGCLAALRSVQEKMTELGWLATTPKSRAQMRTKRRK